MAHAFDLAVNRFMRKLYSYYTSQLCHCAEGSLLHLHEQISTCNSTVGSCRAIPWPWKAEDRFSVYSICCLFRLKYFVKMRSSLFEPQLQNGCHQAHLHRDSPLHVCFSQMMQNQSVLIHHAHGDMCAVADHADHSQWWWFEWSAVTSVEQLSSRWQVLFTLAWSSCSVQAAVHCSTTGCHPAQLPTLTVFTASMVY